MREFIRHQLFLFKQERTDHLGSTKTGGQIQAQAHTVTATTPVQPTTLLSVNSVINYPHKIQFIDCVNNGIEQIKYFKAGRIK